MNPVLTSRPTSPRPLRLAAALLGLLAALPCGLLLLAGLLFFDQAPTTTGEWLQVAGLYGGLLATGLLLVAGAALALSGRSVLPLLVGALLALAGAVALADPFVSGVGAACPALVLVLLGADRLLAARTATHRP